MLSIYLFLLHENNIKLNIELNDLQNNYCDLFCLWCNTTNESYLYMSKWKKWFTFNLYIFKTIILFMV